MTTTARIATTSAWALALAALLAGPALADGRPRSSSDHGRGSSGGHEVRGSRDGHGSRQVSPRQTAPRSASPRTQVPSSPRFVPPSVPQRPERSRDVPGDRGPRDWHPAPQQQTPRGVPNPRLPDWRPDARRDPRGVPNNLPPRWRPDGRDGGRHDDHRYDDRRWDGRRHESWRYDGWRDGHHRYRFDGRVRRLEHYHGGYRFWLDDCHDPFWIPEARFLLWPLRVGLSVQFGGYWNSAGYYVYDPAPVVGTYDATGLLQGTFIGYDARAGVLTLRDDRSGRYVDVVLRGNDLDPFRLRTGDWLAFSGAWNRGYFEAWRLEDLRER